MFAVKFKPTHSLMLIANSVFKNMIFILSSESTQCFASYQMQRLKVAVLAAFSFKFLTLKTLRFVRNQFLKFVLVFTVIAPRHSTLKRKGHVRFLPTSYICWYVYKSVSPTEFGIEKCLL